MNNGWKPDWNNDDQPKYGVYYSALLGLDIATVFHAHRHIVFETKQMAEFSMKNHAKLWKKFWMVLDF